MDVTDITQRVIAILTAEPVVDVDGVPQIPAEFAATRADLDALIKSSIAPADLEDLAKAMDAHKEMLTDPLLVGALDDMLDGDHEPEPEIFDAIESGDVESVRAALRSCDVNARYGK